MYYYRRTLTILLIMSFLPSLLWSGWGWEPKLSSERYRMLNTFQRSEYDKGIKLFENKNYRAAANQFEKFKVQFIDSPILPHVIFMRAYSLQKGKDRNKAIKGYNDVMDYFGDVIEDAAPALYYMGIAHLQNGDTREGMKALNEMAEDVDYQKHPLAAGAIRRLADNHAQNKEMEQAMKYWKQVYRDFRGSNRREAENAKDSLAQQMIRQGQYEEYLAWIGEQEKKFSDGEKVDVIDDIYQIADRGFGGRWNEYNDFNKAEKTKDMESFYAFFTSKESLYTKTNNEWYFLRKKIDFLGTRLYDKNGLTEAIETAIAMAEGLDNKGERDKRLIELVDYFKSRDLERAKHILQKVSAHYTRVWKQFDLYMEAKDYKMAESTLINIEKMDDKKEASKALSTRADLYAKKMNKYEEAIKLYQEISNPPSTLWAIADCYFSWRKPDQGIRTLVEIESAFPDQAPQAAIKIAQQYHRQNEAKKAIGKCRQILKAYPKSRAASEAHQMLEKYGIQTGGGVIDQ